MATSQICTFEPEDFALSTNNWPYTDADLNRLDNSDDSNFYDTPRFVTHIDESATESLTDYYREEMNAMLKKRSSNNASASSSVDVLDLCSSWISHLPSDIPLGRVVGVGMNGEELAANPQLTEYVVQDLNKNPVLADFEDGSFDVVCNVVSVDYLTNPLEVFKETHRVLKPNGVALISFSNRCFPTKAVAMWLQADDIGRLTIVASYFHYAAIWKTIEAIDCRPQIETPARPSFKDVLSDPNAG
eukprot:CAMPEP_0195524494 /NCGR_PEP_ID=MMETSP0794_2-20130614/24366_1 /TAXON_ID=515487 /ORGANISM="Stephanopyxis turris, Strain CCMP 815" /LENGTH=244 /DNA_ID=CAMNT_0040654729 /DNA_START=181 /DNA_END=912 /DNA_ORIENTATION=+